MTKIHEEDETPDENALHEQDDAVADDQVAEIDEIDEDEEDEEDEVDVLVVSSESEPEASDAPEEGPPESKQSRFVQLDDLTLEYKHWRNPRSITGLDSDSIDRLAQSIKARTTQMVDAAGNVVTHAGVNDPLLVVQIAVNGEVVNLVLDGQRRYRAASKVLPQDAMIPVIDREPEPVAEWTPGLAARYLTEVLDLVGTREGLSSYEISESAERLRAEKNPDTGAEYTMEQVGVAVGRSASWVSKILKARAASTPKTLLAWRKGKLTEEQFKAATSERQPDAQDDVVEAVVSAAKSGDKGTARALAKEQKEKAKAKSDKKEKDQKKDKKKEKGSKKEKGDPAQTEMPSTPPRKPPPFAVVEDLVGTAEKRPPTHDYVKGIIDGAKWATGLMDSALFAKAWQVYLSHVASGGKDPVATKAPAAPAVTGSARKKAKAKRSD